MGGSSTTLSIILKLVDDASAAMQGVGANLKSVGESMTSAGRTLTTDVTLPIVGIGVAATKMASDFQASMTQLVTQAGLPADQLQKLTDAVEAFAASGAQQTPEVLAQGLYHIVSLGVPAADAMNVLKLASEGAAIGHANLEDVATALGAAVASNIKGSGDYQNAMATLNATVGAGNMRMQDLATALGNVLPQATTAGLSLEDVGAAMATMTDNGMPAADAATRLHMAISLMEAPTKQATKALESVGITQLQLADDMRNKGLLAALTDLHDHLVETGLTANQQAQVLTEAFGGGRTSGSIELLLNNLDRVGQKYQLIDQGVLKFGGDVSLQSQTSAAQFAEAQSKMADAAVMLGNTLQGPVGDVLNKLADILVKIAAGFAALPRPVQDTIIVLLGILAALGPLLLVLGSAITVIGTLITVFSTLGPIIVALSGPIGILVLALGALTLFIITHWKQIKDGTQQFADDWKAIWTALSTWWTTFWNGIFDTINGVWSKIQGVINTIRSAIASVTGAVSSIAGAASSVVSSVVSHVTSVHDAVITPSGQVIQTDPADYLFATKNPGGLGGGGSVNVYIQGGNYLDATGATMIANAIGKQIVRQLKVSNFN